jgi:hypothetical protein
VGSTLDFFDTLETDICGEIGTPGLWYQVIAVEDGIMRASTCSKETSIDTAITVMTGSDCGNFTCVKSANSFEGVFGCIETGIIIEWNSISSQTYLLYIRGTTSTGIFGVTIQQLLVPVNDVCAVAAVISSEEGIIQGSTENATEDFILGAACEDDTYVPPRGVWYKIAGRAKFLQATLCPRSRSLQLSVYKGDCSGLICAAESYYINCGSLEGRTVSWEALDGVDYYLFIHSPFASSGSFELHIEELDTATNIRCATAEGPLIPANQKIISSTIYSVPDGLSGCLSGFFNSAGMWYSVLGTGGLTYRVDTTYKETHFDTEISIYVGSCDGELECVIGNSGPCGGPTFVQWKTEEGVLYYIKIHGYNGAMGDFGMTLSSLATPKNDACLDNISLSPSIDKTIVVSTVGSTPDVIPAGPDFFHNTPGVWYRVEGNYKAIFVSTCSPLTHVATLIKVFTGYCEHLIPVTESFPDYSCQGTFAAGAVFLAKNRSTYFILLQSPDGYGGDVGLTITEFENADNDACLDGTVLSPDSNVSVVVSTAGSTPDVIPVCSSALSDALVPS